MSVTCALSCLTAMSRRLPLGAAAWLGLPGCLLAPPVEIEAAQENLPPYIDYSETFPAQEVVFADDTDTIELSAGGLFDPNPEPELFYVWYSATRSEVLDSTNTVLIERGELFSQYAPVSISINPCARDLQGRQSESIWLYLTDRRWERVGSAGVVPAPGAFLTARAWTLDLSFVVCT